MPPRPAPVSHERLIAEREGYSVSAIRIETLPGHWVTGNLYRPNSESSPDSGGPFPAVLCPHGHWPAGRFTDRADLVQSELASGAEIDAVAARYHLQARCVHLARMGCLVLHYDMVGYADSRAINHNSDLATEEAQLWGVSHLGLQTWNSLRLVDHLCSRADVDATRIGMTGGSGGGTQTFLLAALDERIRAAFPAVMVSTEMQGGCVCENAPHLRVDTSNIGIAALIAPRPLGMSAANDWTLHIEERGLPELKEVWALYDRADAVQARCFPQFGHNYNSLARAEMYAFLARHLELGATPPERTFLPLTADELSVYSAATPRPDEADAAAVLQWWQEQITLRLDQLRVHDRPSLTTWREHVQKTLRAMLHTTPAPRAEVLARRDLAWKGGSAEELTLSRPGATEALQALWVEPGFWSGRVTLIASSAPWRERLHPEAWEELRAASRAHPRDALLLIDTLGVDSPLGPRFDDARSGYEGYTTCYNRSLIAERVHDILTAIAYAHQRSTSHSVHLVGLDRAGPWAILAAALAPDALASLTTNRSWDFTDLHDARHPDFLPGALRLGGMTGITTACAPLAIEFTEDKPITQELQAAWLAAGVELPSVAP
jgi:hypothetical protein